MRCLIERGDEAGAEACTFQVRESRAWRGLIWGSAAWERHPPSKGTSRTRQPQVEFPDVESARVASRREGPIGRRPMAKLDQAGTRWWCSWAPRRTPGTPRWRGCRGTPCWRRGAGSRWWGRAGRGRGCRSRRPRTPRPRTRSSTSPGTGTCTRPAGWLHAGNRTAPDRTRDKTPEHRRLDE